MTTKIENEFKPNLADFTKIPPKEFERHFREWMERDDVARALQAKLRTDLILNFNKTSLGKQILAQTTMTTGGGYGASGNQRLTLSPLILALNTLVAEFLYAQNCHFSLSVFCTEVPFRNTLPDFESTRYFRFTETEISEIFDAIFGATKCELMFKNQISKNYAENVGVSLLWLILKALLEKSPDRQYQTMQSNLPSVEEEKDATGQTNNTRDRIESEKTTRHDVKTETYNTNIRYLNKYLIILSKKVSEMALYFDNLQQQNQISRPRLLKTARLRKYEHLNRSLERITENLRHMSHVKRKSKRIGAIVSAIDALALQFGKCAANFENVVIQGITTAPASTTTTKAHAEKQTETEYQTEKSYLDWVHEMRHSSNGQKFLDRIEVSLRKALNKQKEQLHNETQMKLRHQKELLKIHYKQKLMEQSEQESQQSKTKESKVTAVPLATQTVNNPLIKDAVNTRKQLQAMVKNITEQERNVDHIVYDAKLRMQELEHEGNQLEQSFRDYLERQRRRREDVPPEVSTNQRQNFYLERERLRDQYVKEAQHCNMKEKIMCDEDLFMCNDKIRGSKSSRRASEQTTQLTKIKGSIQRIDYGKNFEFRNAILDAKKKFFDKDRKFRENAVEKTTAADTTITSIVLQQSMAKMQELFGQKQISEERAKITAYDTSTTTESLIHAAADVTPKVDGPNNNADMQPNQPNQYHDIISEMAIRPTKVNLEINGAVNSQLNNIIGKTSAITNVTESVDMNKVAITIDVVSNVSSSISDESKVKDAIATANDNTDEEGVVQLSFEEIGEIVEVVNPDFEVIVKSENSSSSVSSIANNFSTGGGGGDHSAESGSDFWQ